MANSYTTILGLALPAKGDVDWDDEINGNLQKLESHQWQKKLPAPLFLEAVVLGSGAVGAFLVAGQTYYYKVTAINAAGETTPSNEATVTEGATAYPIRLSWDPVAGATGYKIYKSTSTNAEQLLATIGAVTSWDDLGSSDTTAVNPPASNTTEVPTAADTVDGFHASQTPGNAEIPVLANDGKYPAKDGSLITNVDALSVGGIQANASASASKLYPLDVTAKFPNAVLNTGTGNNLDADKVDGFNASQAPGANEIPVLDGTGKLPAIDGSQLTNLSVSVPDSFPRWEKISKTYADFTSAGTSEDIELYSAPAGTVVHGVKIKHSAAFNLAGYKLSVGIASALTKYASQFDVNQAIGDGVFQLSHGFFSEDHANAVSVRLAAVASAALNTATQGTVDVWLLVSKAV